jgi:hypothetical protein
MVLLWAVPAHAQFRSLSKYGGDGHIRLDLQYQRRDEPTVANGLTDTIQGGFALRGAFGPGNWGILASVDCHVGAGAQGGFVYELDLLPLGLAYRIGDWFLIGTNIGLGVSGVTRHVPFAMQVPLEAIVDVDLGRRIHISAWGRGKWISVADGRSDGSESISWVDETDAAVALRLGKGKTRYRNRWGNGYFIAGTVSEQLGTRSYGVILGYAITTAFRPKRRNRRPYMPRVRPTGR